MLAADAESPLSRFFFFPLQIQKLMCPCFPFFETRDILFLRQQVKA